MLIEVENTYILDMHTIYNVIHNTIHIIQWYVRYSEKYKIDPWRVETYKY